MESMVVFCFLVEGGRWARFRPNRRRCVVIGSRVWRPENEVSPLARLSQYGDILGGLSESVRVPFPGRVKTQCQDPGNEDVAVGGCSVSVERLWDWKAK